MKKYYCFNIITEESFKCNGIKEVEELTGCESNHVAITANESRLFNNEWIIINIENYQNSLGVFKLKYKIPSSYLTPYLNSIKQELRDKIYDSIVDKYPNDLGSKPIYIIKNNIIIETFYSYQKVSQYLKIPIGTVRSRLNRISTLQEANKYSLIKSEVYNKLIHEKL